MEPLHITEFASKRYFDKINQHPRDQQQQPQQQPQHQQHQQQNDGSLLEASSSKFILPIRQVEKQGYDPQAKHVDHIRAEKERERERRRLFGLGRLRPSKSSVFAPEPHTPQNLRRPSIVSVVSTSSVGEGSGVKTRRYASFNLYDKHYSALTWSLACHLTSFS